ncbi:MAG: hypothetical protein SWH68_00070 [Thermodesulfobacteriota bacterium]|nr:hypothetical protein [Thermodesulfobacteriota bacterium]
MEEKYVKSEKLANSLALEIYDQSRQVAGDRWLVALTVRVRVPVEGGFFREGGQTSVDIDAIRKALGDHVVFEQKRERHFVDENDKDTVWNDLYERFTAGTGNYIAHPEFPMKFIVKQYKEYLAKQARYGTI